MCCKHAKVRLPACTDLLAEVDCLTIRCSRRPPPYWFLRVRSSLRRPPLLSLVFGGGAVGFWRRRRVPRSSLACYWHRGDGDPWRLWSGDGTHDVSGEGFDYLDSLG